MVTASDVAALRTDNIELARMAERDLSRAWSSLDLSKPYAARDSLLEIMPVLTDTYGEYASVVAADWYDGVRVSSDVAGRYMADMAVPFPVEAVRARVRYGAGHLFTATPEMMLPFLYGALQEYVLQPGRDTIQGSAARDPQAAGWKRMTSAGACRFCQMLAGRGGVYKESTVNFAAHGDCNCTAVPSWDPKAPEVPVMAYKASERAYRKSPEQLAKHNREIRAYLDRVYPVT